MRRVSVSGFTLIELIVVVAIIAVLAGLVTAASQVGRKRAARAKAESAIATLEAALGMYQTDLGDYPESGNLNLVKALSDEETHKDNSDWQGPYMRFKDKELSQTGEFLDSWGDPYTYVKGGVNNGPSFYDLSSLGPDGKESSDDVTNW